jgi:hypothetical protein
MMPAAVVITILPNCEERGTSRELGQCIAESFGATHQGHGLSRRRRVSRVALDAWEQHSTVVLVSGERIVGDGLTKRDGSRRPTQSSSSDSSTL